MQINSERDSQGMIKRLLKWEEAKYDVFYEGNALVWSNNYVKEEKLQWLNGYLVLLCICS